VCVPTLRPKPHRRLCSIQSSILSAMVCVRAGGQVASQASTGSTFSPFRVYSFAELSADAGSTMDAVMSLASTTYADLMVMVNGAWQPTLAVSVASTFTVRVVGTSLSTPDLISPALVATQA
jgi:hypothetical protein